MRIAIAGCGLNSDYHMQFAKEYPDAEIVGVVDRDTNRARACAEKYGVPGVFGGIEDLLANAQPDVIHIVTPPMTHYDLAREALLARCHVLVEKPLALNLGEATELYDLAEKQGVTLCAMHNHFFDPCMGRARELIDAGSAGEIMNVESYYGLNTRIPAFRDYPAPNVLPWLYSLPGGVYHDFMAHPLYVMLDYTGRPLDITVMQKSHGVLPQNMADEIKIVINGERAFGTLTFSFAARPHLHFLRLYGTRMMVEVDFNTMTMVSHPLSSLPKAAQKATYNLSASWQLFKSTVSNVSAFVRGRLKPYHGMQILIHRYYDSVLGNAEIPVTREQALLVVEVMDEIWKQVRPKELQFDAHIPQKTHSFRHKEKVLVTGGTGFLGKKVVQGLMREGYPVRVLARKLSDIEPLKKAGVEIFFGDVADRPSLQQAFQGVNVVIHAAAGTSGNKQDCSRGTIEGTANVLALCESNRVKKLIYISSCSVYGVADYRTNQIVTEMSELERFPSRRGDYSASKQAAENHVRFAVKSYPAVILRPGTIYGPGGELFSPMIGLSLFNRLFVVFGRGGFVLPYVYIDNLVDAILKSIRNEQADNQIFNVVDDHAVTKKQYMQKLIRQVYPNSPVIYFPLSLLYGLTLFQEMLFGLLKRPPVLTRYRLLSSQRRVRYDSSRIAEKLQWRPLVSFDRAVEEIVAWEKARSGARTEERQETRDVQDDTVLVSGPRTPAS